ncbi:PTS transporter subunit EIIC, partial [Streptococcus iniae]
MDTFLQEKLLPIAVKLGNNKWLIAIRDGITFAMPLLIIGSLLMVIASFPIPGWENWLKNAGVLDYFWKGVDSSFGLIGLVSSFGVAYSLAKLYKTDGVPS